MERSGSTDDFPGTLPGFSHINRYWDPNGNGITAKILPGQYYVTVHDEAVVTTLGSCVSACIRDRVFGIGGMNHFMLPDERIRENGAGTKMGSESARYGVFAMELLINEILKNGGRRENLEIKITGGGQVLANHTDIGKRNIDFVRHFLDIEGLEVTAEEVGDIYPRKVYYFPNTGKVRVRKLRNTHRHVISKDERDYRESLLRRQTQSHVELFSGD